MNGFLCNLTQLLSTALTVYTILMFVYAVVSWIPGLRGRWTDYLGILIEPVLAPVRRIIPPIGGLDIAFLVVILLLQVVVRPLLNTAIVNACFRLY